MEQHAASVDPLQRLVELAKNDLASQLAVKPEHITVESVDTVTWRDGALGCPTPDGVYTQALVPGFRVVVSVAGVDYYYHAGTSGQPFLCPKKRRREPLRTDSDQL